MGKRQSLIPFPRVGRSSYSPLTSPIYFRDGFDDSEDVISLDADGWDGDVMEEIPKRSNGGMWFGPRLGRRNKRSTEDKSIGNSFKLANLLKNPWVLLALKGKRFLFKIWR